MPERKHWAPCDFCGSTPAVAHHYLKQPAHPLILDADELIWAACTVCHAYIVRGDQPRHLGHVLRMVAAKQNVPVRLVEHLVTPGMTAFWRLRSGAWALLVHGETEAPGTTAGR